MKTISTHDLTNLRARTTCACNAVVFSCVYIGFANCIHVRNEDDEGLLLYQTPAECDRSSSIEFQVVYFRVHSNVNFES